MGEVFEMDHLLSKKSVRCLKWITYFLKTVCDMFEIDHLVSQCVRYFKWIIYFLKTVSDIFEMDHRRF